MTCSCACTNFYKHPHTPRKWTFHKSNTHSWNQTLTVTLMCPSNHNHTNSELSQYISFYFILMRVCLFNSVGMNELLVWMNGCVKLCFTIQCIFTCYVVILCSQQANVSVYTQTIKILYSVLYMYPSTHTNSTLIFFI